MCSSLNVHHRTRTLTPTVTRLNVYRQTVINVCVYSLIAVIMNLNKHTAYPRQAWKGVVTRGNVNNGKFKQVIPWLTSFCLIVRIIGSKLARVKLCKTFKKNIRQYKYGRHKAEKT